MADWQTRLRELGGLSDDDKLYVEGKLLDYWATIARLLDSSRTMKPIVTQSSA
jgi:hypothetical protein